MAYIFTQASVVTKCNTAKYRQAGLVGQKTISWSYVIILWYIAISTNLGHKFKIPALIQSGTFESSLHDEKSKRSYKKTSNSSDFRFSPTFPLFSLPVESLVWNSSYVSEWLYGCSFYGGSFRMMLWQCLGLVEIYLTLKVLNFWTFI